MDTTSTRLTGRAWLAAALALLLTPICARADDSPSDRHEIPTFVLAVPSFRPAQTPPRVCCAREQCRERTHGSAVKTAESLRAMR
jgi:hypothetical protein